MGSEFPSDPGEWMKAFGIDPMEVELNATVDIFSKTIDKAAEIREHAVSRGFSPQAAETLALTYQKYITGGSNV